MPPRRRQRGGAGQSGYWTRSGLRTRVTIAFAAGAAALSGCLAGGTYAVAHHYLLSERQSTAEFQAFTDARLVKQELAVLDTNVTGVLSSLEPGADTRSLIYRGGTWYSTSVSVGHSALPTALLSVVRSGTAATQRVMLDGSPAIAIGLPLPAVDTYYFEVHSLSELARTLDVLAAVLGLAALVTTVGGLVMGRWASGRLVNPLREVARVAEAISHGGLDRRLAAVGDSDLAPLVTSFNEMVEALSHRIERDTRFASDVSHELRSPLTTLQASIGVLDNFRSSLPSEGAKALDLLGTEIQRFSVMVQDLLEISRIDAAAAGLELEELPLDEVVTHTVAAFSHRSIPVQVEPGAKGTVIRADRRRLQRVLVNLLDNADKYGRGAVAVSVGCADGRAWINVDDAGPGVLPAERQKVFERFYRGAVAGRRSEGTGTGLGLALASEHVRAHSGRIWVEDSPAGGARFSFELPVGGP